LKPGFALVALVACHHASVVAPGPIPADTRELVVGVVDDWSSTTASLTRYRGGPDGWTRVGAAWPGVVGKSGLAWGDGLHGLGAPAGHPGPIKREGDGASPAGVFALTGSYGYAATPPTGARMHYTALDDNWQCVDDPSSTSYTRILDKRTVPAIDWKSHEDMRRPDALYAWVIDVAHNAGHTPSHGSCIFLHVWNGPASTTVGCTAMAEPELAMLVATLDPRSVFVLLPRAEYTALATSWHLPPL
jgi:L,D-peptidoglycan transpeptidase YkuD (ErfK/YbiS/YcfS/YnhG family)